MSVLVVCPTRDRPKEFGRLCEAVAATSQATVAAYIDDDQINDYLGVLSSTRTTHIVGPRIGPAAAANRLIAAHPGFDAYGFLTDDCTPTTPGWDAKLLRSIELFPGRIGAVSPYVEGIPFMSFPFASKEWITAVHYFAHPCVYHFCWDTMIELMAEHVGVLYATKDEFAIYHPHHESSNLAEHWNKDRLAFFSWCLCERPAAIERLKLAARKAAA
jgi:hypothetical protein